MIILSRKEKKISKWLTLVKKKVKNSNHDQETYYSFKTFNYIVIIAKNKCGKISVVRQFRPAREKNTLEFPAGLKDKKISIKEIVKNELKEETGLIPISNIKLICKLTTDNGRMENNLFGYFVKTKTINKKGTEKEIKHYLLSKKKIDYLIKYGKFNHALHIAVYHIALKKGYI
jgi:ADP-ribose pyrophosphatase